MRYISTKTYGHDLGLSACFRQWRATHSHCRFIHGYALAVHIEFESDSLDDRNWVVDFGGLSEIRDWLKDTFDHKLLVAADDPDRDHLEELAALGLAQIRVVKAVGCEAFSKLVAERVETWLSMRGLTGRVSLRKVEVREHGANSAAVEMGGF